MAAHNKAYRTHIGKTGVKNSMKLKLYNNYKHRQQHRQGFYVNQDYTSQELKKYRQRRNNHGIY